MANIYTIQNSIIQVLYTFGSIYRVDLISLLNPYSKSPERYVKSLISSGVCEFNETKKLISLTPKTIKSYAKTLNHKATTKLVDNHDYITAKVLMWYLTKQDVDKYQIEKKVIGTSLQADLYIKLRNGFEIYIESDTGNERVVELRNKILNYDSLDSNQMIVIVVTKTDINYKNLIDITIDKPSFNIYLDSNLNKSLECITHEILPLENLNKADINNIINLNNNIKNKNSTLMSLDEIQKLITSI